MDEPEWDPNEMSFVKYMIAGATAGVAEHVCMFPIDTVKTRMQANVGDLRAFYTNVFTTASSIIRTEGLLRLYRGVTAVVLGAMPSHAVHFCAYELAKVQFGANEPGHHPLAIGASGVISTMCHDAVGTPMDVVKQRLQLPDGVHASGRTDAGVSACIRSIYKHEGLRPFYASYPTTVLLNIPFVSVQFATYESMKIFLGESAASDLSKQFISGACAGALAGFASNPLDVIKTRLQTQQVAAGALRQGPHSIVQQILSQEGWRGLFRGTSARMMYFTPSAAISWTIYESMKRWLR